jgi:hypothetical protein
MIVLCCFRAGTNVILECQQRLTEYVPRADLVLFVLSLNRILLAVFCFTCMTAGTNVILERQQRLTEEYVP